MSTVVVFAGSSIGKESNEPSHLFWEPGTSKNTLKEMNQFTYEKYQFSRSSEISDFANILSKKLKHFGRKPKSLKTLSVEVSPYFLMGSKLTTSSGDDKFDSFVRESIRTILEDKRFSNSKPNLNFRISIDVKENLIRVSGTSRKPTNLFGIKSTRLK